MSTKREVLSPTLQLVPLGLFSKEKKAGLEQPLEPAMVLNSIVEQKQEFSEVGGNFLLYLSSQASETLGAAWFLGLTLS